MTEKPTEEELFFKTVQNLTLNHIAKRKGISSSDMNEFMHYATPKVMQFLMVYDLQPTPENFDKHYGDIMGFINKSDEQIEALIEASESGKELPKLTAEPQSSASESVLDGLGLKTLLIIAAFLLVAWQAGKNWFIAALAVVGLWWYMKDDKPAITA